MDDWTIEDEIMTEDYFDDDDTWVHDQDSDHPMEIIDY